MQQSRPLESGSDSTPGVEFAPVHSMRILVADDNRSDRMILASMLRREGHQVLAVEDGKQAIQAFENERPQMVLLDALMPKMDGFEAARRIKALAGDELVPIIFLTSLQEADELVRCLEAGGDDFLSKPYNKVILRAKISAFERMRTMHATLREQRNLIGETNTALVREQEVAKEIFDNVAHSGCLDAPNIKFLMSPLAIFNGDVLLANRSPHGGMYVLLGDFTGHGLPAAMGIMPMSEIFYGMTAKGFQIEDVLREINRKLKHILPVGFFSCACMVDVDFRTGMMKVWQGGLPNCFLYRRGSREVELVESTHLPLGVMEPGKFDASFEVYSLQPGDRFFMWSDGIHEVRNAAGEMFGEDGLMHVFEGNLDPTGLFDEVIGAVSDFLEEDKREDDLTMVELTMVESSELETLVPRNDRVGDSGPKDWKMSFELGPESLKSFNPLPLLQHLLMEVPGLRGHSSDLFTVLSELYSNALEHGVIGLDSSLKSGPEGFAAYYAQREKLLAELKEGSVRFHFHHEPTEFGGRLHIEIADSGPGFDFERYLASEGTVGRRDLAGRGIPLVMALCNRVDYWGHGNEVRAVYEWHREPQP
jgi:CheY-like chemotaxis protein